MKYIITVREINTYEVQIDAEKEDGTKMSIEEAIEAAKEMVDNREVDDPCSTAIEADEDDVEECGEEDEEE